MNEFLNIFMKGAPFLFQQLFNISIEDLPRDEDTSAVLVLIYNLYSANRITKFDAKELVVKLKAKGAESVMDSFDKIGKGEF